MDYAADVATDDLMGDDFLESHPGITQDLREFDGKFSALLTGVPLGLAKAKEAREKLKAAFTEWNRAAMDTMKGKQAEQKWSDLSDIFETMRLRLKAMQRVDTEEPYATAQNLAVYWGLMVNANKLHFWIILHVISSPELLSTIQGEIAPFAKFSVHTGKLNLDVDSLVNSCLVLKATFFEVMRTYTAGVSYKKVLQDVTLIESVEDAVAFRKPTPQSYQISTGSFSYGGRFPVCTRMRKLYHLVSWKALKQTDNTR